MRKPKVTPIGEVLSFETAFTQAVNCLDMIQYLAIENGDTETLMKVAVVYADMGYKLMGYDEEPEDEEHGNDCKKQPLGFAPTPVIEVEEVEEVHE